MEENNFDVIIVGAGMSGLTAALELSKNKKKVCVLEARNRVGGRIFSSKTPSGKIIEFGAQWVGDDQKRLHDLLSEFSIKTFDDYPKGKHILNIKNTLTYYDSEIPPLPWINMLDLHLNLYRVEKASLEVPIEAAYQSKYAEQWDGMTVETWANTHIHTQEIKDLLDIYMESVFAISPRDMSFLYFLSCIHNSGGTKYNVNQAYGKRVTGGLSQLCEAMAKKLEGMIQFNSPVQKISQTASQLTVSTATKSYTASKAIVAIPPIMASQITFKPHLPPMRDKLHQRMPMGSVVKCFAIYKKPFWRNEGFSGKVVTDKGLVRLVYDASPEDDSYGALLIFLLGNSVMHIQSSSNIWIADTVVGTLTKFFGEEAREPIEFVFYNWNEDPWSRGGYAGYMPPGVMTSVGKTISEPTGNIYWAGTEMSTEFHGYIEGAIQSGHVAARKILFAHQANSVS